MFRVTVFFLKILSHVIAHPFIGNLDYSSFFWLPGEAIPDYTNLDNFDSPDAYSLDFFDDDFQNNWEISCLFSFPCAL